MVLFLDNLLHLVIIKSGNENITINRKIKTINKIILRMLFLSQNNLKQGIKIK